MAGSLRRSPLAPPEFPPIGAVGGVRLAAGCSNTRYRDRDDLLLAVMDPGTAIAGVLTRSSTAAPPVEWCRAHLPGGLARAIVVNAGNANAFTGRAGRALVAATTREAASLIGCPPEQVFVASTGTIGEKLPEDALARALPGLAERLAEPDWPRAAAAIMTTDTFAKGAGRSILIDGTRVTLAGIAKGSGMIQPDMATMLGFLFTDAAIPAPVLDTLLRAAVAESFNRITVDSDTSTSDTVLFCATGAAGHDPVESLHDPRLAPFVEALKAVCHDLAQQVVRDGEGASKFIAVTVSGAVDEGDADRVARAIANSPLVKTAIAGEDANWGRIVMAVGKSGAQVDRDRLSVSMGGIVIAADGEAVPDYDEAPVTAHMQGREIEIRVDLGLGTGEATVWTCDLTQGYIAINADYRT